MENQQKPGMMQNSQSNQNNPEMDNGEMRYGRLYNVIDAFIDTVNLAPNRRNAIKYGIRAVGEILSEFPHPEGTEHESGGQGARESKTEHSAVTNQGSAQKTPGRG